MGHDECASGKYCGVCPDSGSPTCIEGHETYMKLLHKELDEQLNAVKVLIDENKQLKEDLREARAVIQQIAKQRLEDINPAENSLEVKAQLLEWCINLARKHSPID